MSGIVPHFFNSTCAEQENGCMMSSQHLTILVLDSTRQALPFLCSLRKAAVNIVHEHLNARRMSAQYEALYVNVTQNKKVGGADK